MKAILNVSVALGMAITLGGCCKNKEEELMPEAEPTVYPNYFQLRVGNYWIYERYTVNIITGQETPLSYYDSCYIEKDTLITGIKYAKYIRGNTVNPDDKIWFVRDSLHYAVRSNGAIVFSSTDFSSIFSSFASIAGNDTIAVSIFRMTDKDSTVLVPAGSFATSNFQAEIHLYPPYNTLTDDRYMDKRYAKTIGLIEETLATYSSSTDQPVRKLIRYHLN